MKEKGDIIFYEGESDKVQIEVKLKNDSVWLNLSQMADLFGRDKSVISKHLSNVFKEKELIRDSVVAKNATTGSRRNSLSSNRLEMCREMTDLSRWKRSAI